MKKYASLYLAALSFIICGTVLAEESAVVTEYKINVRGQPSLVGEVVTQLQKGEKVTIIERIPVQNAKPGEPTNWAKIKLPANTPVWAFAPFIKEGTVAVSRLNLRAGPGENYSVIGRIPKGAAVKEIHTEGQWIEIEAPQDAYAYVDASLVKVGGEATPAVASTVVTPQKPTGELPKPPSAAQTNKPIASTVQPQKPTGEAPIAVPSPVTNKPAITNPPETEVAKVEPKVSSQTEASVPEPTTPVATPETRRPPVQEPLAPVPMPVPQPAATAANNSTNPPVASIPVPTPQARELPKVAEAPAVSNEPLPKRVVRREGYVRPTKSIQAPTWFELASNDTKKTMNYLHSEKLEEQGVNLKDFRGLKVIVTGEEGLDERWPKVPILVVETIESAP